MKIYSISKYILGAAISAASWGGAVAQDLQKEITVRHDDVPEFREVSKINVEPRISLPAIQPVEMPYSYSQVKVGINGSVSTLSPASFADSIYTSPYRGYATIGFMPAYNLNASAGYKILDTDHTRVNAWMQFNGNSYKSRLNCLDGLSDKFTLRRNTVTIGSALHQAVGSKSFIDAGVDYTFSRFNLPDEFPVARLFDQNVHRFNLSALWSMSTDGASMGFGAFYRYFGYAKSYMPATNARREHNFGMDGFVSARLGEKSSLGVKVKLSMISNSRYYDDDMSIDSWLPDNHHGLLTLTPYYRYAAGKFTLDIGARLDFTIKYGRAFHIAPDVTAVYSPGSFFRIYAKAGGGQWQNTLGSVYDVVYLANSHTAYGNSGVPVTAELGVTIGSWRGFSATLGAEYAMAKNWLMPDYGLGTVGVNFMPLKIKGYRLYASAGYNYRDIVDVRLSYETAPQKENRGYYLWRDRARYVAGVSVRVSPIKTLDITAGWDYRGKRACNYSYLRETYDPKYGYGMAWVSRLMSLGGDADLHAAVTYHITPQWSVFLSGSNLLNHRHLLIGGVESQGLTGLAGVSYKF